MSRSSCEQHRLPLLSKDAESPAHCKAIDPPPRTVNGSSLANAYWLNLGLCLSFVSLSLSLLNIACVPTSWKESSWRPILITSPPFVNHFLNVIWSTSFLSPPFVNNFLKCYLINLLLLSYLYSFPIAPVLHQFPVLHSCIKKTCEKRLMLKLRLRLRLYGARSSEKDTNKLD